MKAKSLDEKFDNNQSDIIDDLVAFCHRSKPSLGAKRNSLVSHIQPLTTLGITAFSPIHGTCVVLFMQLFGAMIAG